MVSQCWTHQLRAMKGPTLMLLLLVACTLGRTRSMYLVQDDAVGSARNGSVGQWEEDEVVVVGGASGVPGTALLVEEEVVNGSLVLGAADCEELFGDAIYENCGLVSPDLREAVVSCSAELDVELPCDMYRLFVQQQPRDQAKCKEGTSFWNLTQDMQDKCFIQCVWRKMELLGPDGLPDASRMSWLLSQLPFLQMKDPEASDSSPAAPASGSDLPHSWLLNHGLQDRNLLQLQKLQKAQDRLVKCLSLSGALQEIGALETGADEGLVPMDKTCAAAYWALTCVADIVLPEVEACLDAECESLTAAIELV